MVQPAKHRQRNDASTLRRLGFAGLRAISSETQVSAGIVIIDEIAPENLA